MGAAVFTSVRLSIDASIDAFTRSVTQITGKSDRILLRSGGRVPENMLQDLIKHPSVQNASPLLSTYVRESTHLGEPFLLIGLDPLMDRTLRTWHGDKKTTSLRSDWIKLISEPNSLFLGKPLTERFGLKPGDRITLEHANTTGRFMVLSPLAPDGLALVEAGNIGITDIATFQEFTGTIGFVDRIDLIFKSSVSKPDLLKFESSLAPGLILRSPSDRRESGQNMIKAYQLNLSILSFASLFVGMFLVYSLVALNAASRRHEIAVLRSTGSSSKLIFLLFLFEGVFLGVAGWVIAIPISTALVKYLLTGISETISILFVRVRVDQFSLSGWEILLSFWMTLIISVLAALQPARMAMQVSPKEALSLSQRESFGRFSPVQLFIMGIVFVLTVLPLSTLSPIQGLPLAGYAAIILLFAGFSLVSPWCLKKAAAIIRPILLRVGGIPAYLAGNYIKNSGTRTSISVGSLITAVALFIALVIMIHSFRNTVELWVNQTVSGDLFVSPKLAEYNQFQDPFPEKIIQGLKSIQSPVDLVPNRRIALSYGLIPYQLEVMDVKTFLKYGSFIWLKGSPQQSIQAVIQGKGVTLSEVFSNQSGLNFGDTYIAQVKDLPIRLPVLGVVRDYRTHGGVVFCDFNFFKRNNFALPWGGVRIFFNRSTENSEQPLSLLQSEIIDNCGPHLDMISGKTLRTEILKIFDETFAITTVLLFIAPLIATMGIATTLAIMVLDRSQQMNILVAVGADTNQIRGIVVWESLLMVIVGEIAGVVCGLILSYLLIFVINLQSFGWTFIYNINWRTLSISLPLILLSAFAAALPAIKLVFRQPPATLLKEN
ncbi:MAG: FtsX-like permease family protein [Thermodesulfobacteriota bacterium]|nr:FtsX-like permease family protein [Thermodesulfobacteriota bacterium]